MPSIRKRIGYLPSINAQETITKIANKENLSQSKVVGILVEEALIARGGFNLQNSHNLIKKNPYIMESSTDSTDNSSFNHTDLDELISDKGVTYKTRKYGHNRNDDLSESIEKYNEELFEQFKQFIHFQKRIEEN